MKYEEIKEWLDLLVEDLKRSREHANFNNQIYCCRGYDTTIPIVGIGMVADTIKLPLKEEAVKGAFGFCYRYSFEYAGVTFASFTNERLEGYAGTD